MLVVYAGADDAGDDEAEDGGDRDVDGGADWCAVVRICDWAGARCDLDLWARSFHPRAIDDADQADADVLRALTAELFVLDGDSQVPELGHGIF